MVPREDGQNVADKCGASDFLECSALEDVGVEEVFHVATKRAMQGMILRKKGCCLL